MNRFDAEHMIPAIGLALLWVALLSVWLGTLGYIMWDTHRIQERALREIRQHK